MAIPPSGRHDNASPGRPKVQRIASYVLYGVLVLVALWTVRDFIPAVAWACVIAIALWPLLTRIEGLPGLRGRTTFISLVLTAAVMLLVVLPIALAIARGAAEAHELLGWFHSIQHDGIPMPAFVGRLPYGSQQISNWWQANLAPPLGQSPAMKTFHGDEFVTLSRHAGARAVHALVLFGFTLLTLFVIFRAGPKLSGSLIQGAQRAFGEDGAQLAQQMASAVRGTVTGLVVVGLGEGALLCVAYALGGVPHATLLGLVTAVAAMLPFCAPIVFGCVALWLLTQGSMVAAIAIAVFGSVVVFIAEHFARPLLIGNSSRLPFLLVLFGILGGAQTFGLIGLFIGPALMTVLMVLWQDWVG
ncbi:AI-2E family transporter [Paraburkholderia phosphatilytica]|uniref:AI-2E family transporter n=1 Tax=Paraburkholderia phosphatilytica TaxID=2282883 RepID=UPI000E500D38|nr:AI-2E family transporter [Paraburkholderia phosphatilytica]